MLDGLSEQLWEHTSSLSATVMNLFRKKHEQIDPDDLNPVKRAKAKQVKLSPRSSLDVMIAKLGAEKMTGGK